MKRENERMKLEVKSSNQGGNSAENSFTGQAPRKQFAFSGSTSNLRTSDNATANTRYFSQGAT